MRISTEIKNLISKQDHTFKHGSLWKKKERWFWLFISPWIIGFIGLTLGPIIYAFAMSFSRFRFTEGLSWVGLRNYQILFSDTVFLKAVSNTIYYAFVSVPLSLVFSFILAYLLNQKLKGITFFRTIFFLPTVIQGVAVFMLWGWIFNPRFGLINFLLRSMGIGNPPIWLESEIWAMPAIIIIGLWSTGWMMLVYLAALQEIPKELYEACQIDGGSFTQKIIHITLPMISPVSLFLLITGMISSMQLYAPAYVLTQGGPNFATTTIALLIYYSAFRWNKMGQGAAMAVLLFISILIFTIIQLVLSGKWVHYRTGVDE